MLHGTCERLACNASLMDESIKKLINWRRLEIDWFHWGSKNNRVNSMFRVFEQDICGREERNSLDQHESHPSPITISSHILLITRLIYIALITLCVCICRILIYNFDHIPTWFCRMQVLLLWKVWKFYRRCFSKFFISLHTYIWARDR